MPLSPEQLHVLQHSLGLDKFGRGRQYRNFYGAGYKVLEYDDG